jgi:xylulokinase
VADPWVLAVDLGTSGLKVGAVGLDGEVVDHVLDAVVTEHPDDEVGGRGATQDARSWWAAISGATRQLVGRGMVDPAALVAVGITGQFGSTVPVDAEGEPAGPVLLWSDDRGGPWSAKAIGGPAAGYAPGAVMRWIRITGGAPSPNGADPTGHALWLRHAAPAIYARTTTLMEPVDYLGFRFTGRRAATPASMLASWLTDNRAGANLGYVGSLVARAGRDAERLPDLVPTGTVLGGILDTVAADLGLPAGVPVVTGLPDLHTAHLGAGTNELYQAHVAISTTAWISCAVPFKKTDVIHQIASVPGVAPGRWLVANNHETAGACLQWLRDQVVRPDDGLPGELGSPAFDELTALAGRAPAGSGGVIFTPWLAGERSPVDDRTLRAAFLNVSLLTDRAALVRAVLEGVAYNARWLNESVERFVKRPFPTMRILGGGSQSELWCQIHADVLGRPVERVADPVHTNLRGAALFAAAQTGRLDAADIASRVRVDRVFEPDPATRAVYDELYGEYKGLYKRLHKLYRRLNR